MIRVLFSTPVMCAAPLVLPQIRRLSVTALMASVAKGLDTESERSTALWWTFVIDIDKPGFEEAESSL